MFNTPFLNKKTPCEYCEYKAICGFNTGTPNNKYNYISEMDKEEVLEMIKENVED
jgi:ATP-dependent helicase/nuclease subunit B